MDFEATKMLAIGLAIGLGPLALYWFGFPFGFMAIVGTMGLVGVAINDSIVVMAAIRANQRGAAAPLPQAGTESASIGAAVASIQGADRSAQGRERKDMVDVVTGCTRHILATTLTTMIGFLPLVIGGGKFWPPLAIVISAGFREMGLL